MRDPLDVNPLVLLSFRFLFFKTRPAHESCYVKLYGRYVIRFGESDSEQPQTLPKEEDQKQIKVPCVLHSCFCRFAGIAENSQWYNQLAVNAVKLAQAVDEDIAYVYSDDKITRL